MRRSRSAIVLLLTMLTIMLLVSLAWPDAGAVPDITGGEPVSAADHPAMVTLSEDPTSRDRDDYRCGGTLVSDRAVVTAAHCLGERPHFDDPDDDPEWTEFIEDLQQEGAPSVPLWVVAGRDDLLAGGGRSVKVEHIWLHPDWFDGSRIKGDLAVLTLAERLPGPPARIATPADDRLQRPGASATMLGYGYHRDEDEGPLQSLLRRATVEIKPDGSCAERVEVDPPSVCAAGPDSEDWSVPRVGGCWGDSGGPLLSGDTLLGVFVRSTSNIGDCATRAGDSVFQRVSGYAKDLKARLNPAVLTDTREYSCSTEHGIEPWFGGRIIVITRPGPRAARDVVGIFYTIRTSRGADDNANVSLVDNGVLPAVRRDTGDRGIQDGRTHLLSGPYRRGSGSVSARFVFDRSGGEDPSCTVHLPARL